jgi:hypothetical protein
MQTACYNVEGIHEGNTSFGQSNRRQSGIVKVNVRKTTNKGCILDSYG